MAVLPPVASKIQQEAITEKKALSEQLFQQFGSNINYLLQQARFDVGEIIPYLFDEAFFQLQYGTNWVLCNGQNVENSVYADITGNSFAPDLRGCFLRQLNDSDTGADANRTLLSFQDSENKNHFHSAFVAGGADLPPYLRHFAPGYWSISIGSPPVPATTKQTYQFCASSGTPDAGEVGSNGGDESVCPNVAIYYYIKVN